MRTDLEYALIGAGGQANDVIAHMGLHMTCFVDEKYWKPNEDDIQPLSLFNPHKYKVLIAIGDCAVRKEMVKKLPKETTYFSYVHPSAQILNSASVEIGEGCMICANTIITTDCKIGNHALLNLGTTIAHNCTIGDYFTSAPSVSISGNCIIGDCVYFGTKSCIREKLSVCSDVTIGMMSGVLKNISQPGVYIGTPAKLIK
jgi:sugar O-acyltransferase (sialic acid O-acetyltransferase NeuD family)